MERNPVHEACVCVFVCARFSFQFFSIPKLKLKLKLTPEPKPNLIGFQSRKGRRIYVYLCMLLGVHSVYRMVSVAYTTIATCCKVHTLVQLVPLNIEEEKRRSRIQYVEQRRQNTELSILKSCLVLNMKCYSHHSIINIQLILFCVNTVYHGFTKCKT